MIFTQAASAQVNVEKYLRIGERRGTSGHVEFDLSHKRGNVDLSELDFELNVGYAWTDMTTFVVLRSDYGWQGGRRFSDEALTHLRHVFRTAKRVQPEIFTQVDYSRPRLLDYRSLLGGGLRFVPGGGGKHTIMGGTSLMGERERYDLGDGNSHPARVTVMRWSSYLSAKLEFGERAGGAVIAYIQPKIDDFADIRLLGEASLRAEIISHLALVLSLNTRYDNRPPDGIKSLDTAIESGLLWTF